jgi:hypothetical protein
MKPCEEDEDYVNLRTKHENSSLGDYMLQKIENIGFSNNLTEILKKYINESSDGSTYRESFISILVSIIGTSDVLNEFLSIYGGEYQIVSDTTKVPKYETKFCVYSGDGDTHYISCTPKDGVYDPYDYNHQIPYTNGFCQTFAVLHTIKEYVGKEYEMKPYDYVTNSYKALKFISFILNTKSLKSKLNMSINEIYKEKDNYDLKSKPKLTLSMIQKIIQMFSKVDIYPGVLFSAEEIGVSDEIINNFKDVDH